jgi:membrane protease YdiL (CAAX protease family)
MSLLVLVLVLSIIAIANTYVINHSRAACGAASRVSSNLISRRVSGLMMKSDNKDDREDSSSRSSGLLSIMSPNRASKVEQLTSIYDIIKPSFIDGESVSAIIVGQGIILCIALVGGLFFGIDVLKGMTINSFYDVYRLKDALILTGTLLSGVWIFDKIPMDMIMKANRETKFALLNLFGLNSSPFTVAAVATFLAGVTAFGEEVFYRGFLLTVLSNFLTPPVGIAASSILFGFLHYPRGVNSLGQMGLGAIYSAAAFFSGSLVVPIVAHTMFDFFTTIFPLYLG